MAKTGQGSGAGTAEAAAIRRAAHALHAPDPVLDDFWAVELLGEESRVAVRDPDHYRDHHAPGSDPFAPMFATAIACLRYAEDEVERCAARGIGQYVVLGAGFDTFALRHPDLAGRMTVLEVDHPDVQALKRARIAAAAREGPLPCFVPVDFERTSLGEALRASAFRPGARCVLSWMNTVPYLSEAAVTRTLADIATLSAPGSRIVLNYGSDRPARGTQARMLRKLARTVAAAGEPFQTRWTPRRLEGLLERSGFAVVDRADEADLARRYFEGRSDGLRPGAPVRLITAERRG